MKKRADGRYQANITITCANGEKKRKTFYGKTPAEVRRAILKYTGEKERGPSLKEVYDEWYKEEWDRIRYNTQVCYKKPIDDVLEEFGDRKILEITTLQIEDFLKELGEKGFSRQTVSVRRVVLNNLYNFAMRKNYINRNPANIAKIPKGLSAKKRELPPEDTRERIGKLSGEGFDLYPILIYYTGMRRSEALALEWSDVDLDKRQIHVSKELEFHGNQPVCVPMTKSAKGLRSITIRLPLLDVMREHQGEGLMFPGRSGGYMTKSAFQRAWRRQQLDAVPHQMRHAYTTDLFEAHVPPETAITQTGHSDVKVMQNIYTHIRKRVMDNTTKLLDQYDSKQEDSSQNVVNDPESTEK